MTDDKRTDFDEDAAREEAWKQIPNVAFGQDAKRALFVAGARWQFERDRAEIEGLRVAVDSLNAANDSAVAERDEEWREGERLRAVRDELAQRIVDRDTETLRNLRFAEEERDKALAECEKWQAALHRSSADRAALERECERLRAESWASRPKTAGQPETTGYRYWRDRAERLAKERDKARRECERLKRIIAREFNENDELGAEYTYVCVLKRECERLRAALEKIVRKAPEKVSREEAADMACEFKLVAREALKQKEE